MYVRTVETVRVTSTCTVTVQVHAPYIPRIIQSTVYGMYTCIPVRIQYNYIWYSYEYQDYYCTTTYYYMYGIYILKQDPDYLIRYLAWFIYLDLISSPWYIPGMILTAAEL